MQQDNIEEIILKKISIYKSKVNAHVIETALNYILNNLKNFKSKSWNCNLLTSANISTNILYDVVELKYVREQEFHKHEGSFGSGVLYLTDNNSSIEFCVFPEDHRKQIHPKKCDLLLFESETFHRVLDSDKQRFSLAFNFQVFK